MRVLALAVGLGLAACNPQESAKPEPAPAPTQAPLPKASAQPAGGGDKFGSTIDSDTPFVPLSKLIEDPNAWNGKRVRTKGEVIAVCQAAGCWADLRPEGATAGYLPTHVTMHNHAFFLPKTAKTKVAELEGNLTVRALSQGEVAHYNSEGASLVAGQTILNVDALGVVLR